MPRHSNQIAIPHSLDDKSFSLISRRWAEAATASFLLPTPMSEDQAEKMASFLIRKLPDKAANGVLTELIEAHELTEALLREIFDRGDKACKVSVCLRTDLAQAVEERCQKSEDPDVREHYQARIKRHRS